MSRRRGRTGMVVLLSAATVLPEIGRGYTSGGTILVAAEIAALGISAVGGGGNGARTLRIGYCVAGGLVGGLIIGRSVVRDRSFRESANLTHLGSVGQGILTAAVWTLPLWGMAAWNNHLWVDGQRGGGVVLSNMIAIHLAALSFYGLGWLYTGGGH